MEIAQLTLRQLDHRQHLQHKLSGSLHYDEESAELILNEKGSKEGLQAELMIGRQGECRARLTQAEREIVRIRCQLEEQAERMTLAGELNADLGELERLLVTWAGWPERNLSGELQATWGASLPRQLESGRLLEALEADTRFDLTTTLDAGQPLALSLNGSAAFRNGLGEWSLADGAQLRFGKKLASSLTVSNLAGAISATDTWHLTLAKSGRLRLRNIQNGDIGVARLDLGLTEPLKLSFADNGEVLLAQPTNFSLGATKLRQKKESLHIQAATVSLKKGSLLSPAGSLQASGLRYDTKAAKLPVASIAADFSLGGDVLTAAGNLSAEAGKLHLDWKLSHNLKRESGQLIFTARPLQFPGAWPLLARILETDDTLALTAGAIAAEGDIGWRRNRTPAGTARVTLDQISGHYRETILSQIYGVANLVIDGQSLSIESKSLRAAMIDPGLPLANAAMQTAVQYPFKGPFHVTLTGLRAEALGGEISSERIDIEENRASNPFMIRLTGIDAGQLAEFRRQEGLSAQGKLDGELPFDWTDKGLKMTAGNLAARAPGGLIRYLGTSSIQQMAESEQSIRMAMQILSDFHFKVLQVRADYQPDGELALHVELKGNNPAYEKGRPIEFNLNIEENVLKLLQSLRTADEISGRLEKKVKKKMQKK